jgi:hypothetical protein
MDRKPVPAKAGIVNGKVSVRRRCYTYHEGPSAASGFALGRNQIVRHGFTPINTVLKSSTDKKLSVCHCLKRVYKNNL